MVDDGLRERKKARTRSSLQAAALRLALSRGADGVTVADIAAAADVSTRTFFNYFSSRDDALIADDLDRGHRFVAAVAAAPLTTPPWSVLRTAAVEAFGTSVLAPGEQALKQHLLRSSPEVLAHVLSSFGPLERQLVHELRRRLAPCASLLPHLVSNAAMAALRAAIETWAETDVQPRPVADGQDHNAGGATDADQLRFTALLCSCFDQLEPAFAAPPDSASGARPVTSSPR